MYLHPKNGPVSFQKCLEMFCFHHIHVFTRCCFQNVSVRVPFSKSTVFKICRQKMCRFRVNGRPIRRIFHRFQNVPASCERSLRLWYPGYSVLNFLQDVNFKFTTAAPNRATVTQLGLHNPSVHFVEYIRWEVLLRILNKSKGSISLGLDSIDMFVPVTLTIYLNT